jgi:hypothetical protein
VGTCWPFYNQGDWTRRYAVWHQLLEEQNIIVTRRNKFSWRFMQISSIGKS